MIISVYGQHCVEEFTSLLSHALFGSGFQVISFVLPDGRGIIKFDKTPPASRSLAESDFVVALDAASLNAASRGVKERGVALFNAPADWRALHAHLPGPALAALKKKHAATHAVDALALSSLAMSPAPAMAGAFAKVFAKLTFKSVREAAAAQNERYAKAAEEGYALVK